MKHPGEKELLASSPEIKEAIRIHRIVSSTKDAAESYEKLLAEHPDRQVFPMTRQGLKYLAIALKRNAKLITYLNEELQTAIDLLDEEIAIHG